MNLKGENMKQLSVKVSWTPPVSPNGQIFVYMVSTFNAMEDTNLSMVCTFHAQVGNCSKYYLPQQNMLNAYFQPDQRLNCLTYKRQQRQHEKYFTKLFLY